MKQKNFSLLPAVIVPLIAVIIFFITVIGGMIWIWKIVTQPGPLGIPVYALVMIFVIVIIIWRRRKKPPILF